MNEVDELFDILQIDKNRKNVKPLSNGNSKYCSHIPEAKATLAFLIATVFCTMLVPIKELVPHVKNILKTILIHHWFAHLLLSMIVFVFTYFMSPQSLLNKIKKPDVLIIRVILLSCLTIIGFYCFHKH